MDLGVFQFYNKPILCWSRVWLSQLHFEALFKWFSGLIMQRKRTFILQIDSFGNIGGSKFAIRKDKMVRSRKKQPTSVVWASNFDLLTIWKMDVEYSYWYYCYCLLLLLLLNIILVTPWSSQNPRKSAAFWGWSLCVTEPLSTGDLQLREPTLGGFNLGESNTWKTCDFSNQKWGFKQQNCSIFSSHLANSRIK